MQNLTNQYLLPIAMLRHLPGLAAHDPLLIKKHLKPKADNASHLIA
jgi:hypothetical protein